jgi:predicted anti-sigma-YlaC factor YlaD
MKCEEIEILLSAYVDGEVTEEEKQIVENHLNVCEVCQAMVAEFSRLHTLYQEMERKEAPPDFRQRVTQRIEATPSFAFSWLSWRLPRLVYVVSVSLLVLLSGTIIALHMTKQPSQQVVDVYAEDILFDQAIFSMNEVFSETETSIAEEILDMIDFAEADTSFFFGDDWPLQNHMSRTLNSGRYV